MTIAYFYRSDGTAEYYADGFWYRLARLFGLRRMGRDWVLMSWSGKPICRLWGRP
jgi:hypothetical protein